MGGSVGSGGGGSDWTVRGSGRAIGGLLLPGLWARPLTTSPYTVCYNAQPLRCRASVMPVPWVGNEKVVIVWKLPIKPKRGTICKDSLLGNIFKTRTTFYS